MKPCTCPLCREPLRNLPHGSRTWHCTGCGETITQGYLDLWNSEPAALSVPEPVYYLPSARGWP